jgi:hypothetical protein
MRTRCTLFAVLVFLGLGASGAMAQGMLVPVSGYDTYGSYGSAAPSYSPAPAAYGWTMPPQTAYSPATSYYAPPSYAATSYAVPSYTVNRYAAPAVAYRPVVTEYLPPAVAYRPMAQYVQPAVAYQPVVAYRQPYAVYRPVVVAGYNAPVYTTPAAVPAGPRVIVRPKVYVEGQPIRNLIKAITP